MNNLAYTSQQIETIGPKIEEKIREEVGATTPLNYEVEDAGAAPMSVKTFFGNMANTLVGGEVERLYALHFDFPQPVPTHLQVSVNRQGVGSHVGMLVYSAKLSKPVSEEVVLEDPKTFGKSKFTGDATVSAKLNANGDLLKRADKLARTESQSGGLTLKIKRCCKIVPHESGSMLIMSTLPRPVKMGFSATVDAQEFFDIAQMVEKSL